MADVRRATADLLEDKPELQEGFRDVLAVDAENETWEFDDIPLDSGTFGEVVSRGIVEKVEGEYAVADREALAAAVSDDTMDSDAEAETGGLPSASGSDSVSLSVPDSMLRFVPDVEFDRRVGIALTGALALVVLFRIIPYPAVFKGGNVVLSGNDPYAYRYVVHQLLAQSANPLDLSVLSSLPSGLAHGEPLMVATLWWVSALFGGASAVGGVLAWYPVVSAVVTALLVYALTVRVTEDRRVGIAAVALLAIIPAHAFRTGLGFADHHAFDYPWLALTALAVVSLSRRDLWDRHTWLWAMVLGVGIGAQTLAWDAGPLLLVPLGVYALVVVPARLRADRSPLRAGGPFVVGIGLGALIAGGVHVAFGWHTTTVIAAPFLLFGVGVAAFGIGGLARRFEVRSRSVAAIEVVGVLGGSLVLRQVLPAFAVELDRGIDFLLSTGGIAETMSLVSGDLGTIIGPIFLFGFALFLAVPYMAWGSWRGYRNGSPKWLVTSVYGWYFLLLALVQIRFGGQLAIFTAVFAGLGLVHVAWWVDLASVPAPFRGDESGRSSVLANGSESESGDDAGALEWPERREAMYTAALGLGVGSLGGLMTPIKHSQLTVDDSMYEAAQFMREYSEERGWEYPENYVFSEWGRNRVYNWFVNGESRSYGYAQSNFGEFVTSSDGRKWYERLRDRAGFVAVEENNVSGGGQAGTIYDQLWSDGFGIETNHYRAVWTDPDDSLRVFTLVPGARVTGPAPANSTVTIDVTAEIGGESRLIALETDVGEHGVYQETVPLPGTYAAGGTNVAVSEDNVQEGSVVSGFVGEEYAHWPFDEGSGEWAYDRVGGHHGRIHGAEWTDEGRSGSALSFDGKDSPDYVEALMETLQEFTISLWAYPTALDVTEGNDYRDIVRSARGSILIFEQNGRISFRLPGVGGDRVIGSGIRADRWQHVAITFDGSVRTVYLDGEQRASDEVSVGDLDWGGQIRLGNQFETPSGHGYAGVLDDVRIYNRVLSSSEIGDDREEDPS